MVIVLNVSFVYQTVEGAVCMYVRTYIRMCTNISVVVLIVYKVMTAQVMPHIQ